MKIDPASFREFVEAYATGTITSDATWRAYDIDRMATSRIACKGLKQAGFKDTSYNGFAAFAAAYDLGTAERAKYLLGLWWAWARVALGIVRGGLKLRSKSND